MLLQSIHVHPVKSGRGLSVERWPVDRLGLAHDRRFMAVTPDGAFLTQRTHPKLALLETSIEGETLRLSAPDLRPLSLPLQPPAGPSLTVQVWDDVVVARCVGAGAADWLSRHLGVAARLVFMPPTTVRPVDPHYAGPDDRVGFADGFPFLLLTQASLDDLNSRLPHPVPMNRFRPNLVVSGARPYAEDTWRRISIGPITFDVVKPCSRCVMTTIDQRTAVGSKEPLRTLATYRNQDGAVMFGQNLVHEGAGVLTVGDRILIEA